MSDQYDEFSELLGAYALDAVDPGEREAIERHLETCPRCRAEVAEHREVASLLSQGSPAPAGVWDRIAAELSPPAPPLRLTVAPADAVEPAADDTEEEGSAAPTVAPVVPLTGGRSWRSPRRLGVILAAAAAIVVAVLGGVAIQQRRAPDRSVAIPKDPTVEVQLAGDAGTARALVDEDGNGYLLAKDLPDPGKGSVYQLWGKVDDQVLSLGTFHSGTKPHLFTVDADRLDGIEAFMVTKEKAPGVVTSTQDPVVIGTA